MSKGKLVGLSGGQNGSAYSGRILDDDGSTYHTFSNIAISTPNMRGDAIAKDSYAVDYVMKDASTVSTITDDVARQKELRQFFNR